MTSAVVAAFSRLPELAAADADIARRGRHATLDVAIGVGSETLIARIVGGDVKDVLRGPFLLRPWTIAIRAEPEVWQAFLSDPPPPGSHDILALSKRGALRIEGNLQPFMASLQVVKDILALPRGMVGTHKS
ncbi:MAG TPA: hypothetical protein PK264_07950 [Hyphomicrobiaceae bacterium]|nr:hypothetical protein [Hyphomicrobiaceae bacterium]